MMDVHERAAAHAAEALRWDGTPDGPPYTRCPECDCKIYEGLYEVPHKCE
jgi:hypothetical protein